MQFNSSEPIHIIRDCLHLIHPYTMKVMINPYTYEIYILNFFSSSQLLNIQLEVSRILVYGEKLASYVVTSLFFFNW